MVQQLVDDGVWFDRQHQLLQHAIVFNPHHQLTNTGQDVSHFQGTNFQINILLKNLQEVFFTADLSFETGKNRKITT
jgi:hypothetical protein